MGSLSTPKVSSPPRRNWYPEIFGDRVEGRISVIIYYDGKNERSVHEIGNGKSIHTHLNDIADRLEVNRNRFPLDFNPDGFLTQVEDVMKIIERLMDGKWKRALLSGSEKEKLALYFRDVDDVFPEFYEE